MSGPGLKHVDSHAAIHEAAVLEAIELNNILEKLLKQNEVDKALEAAYITVEHWETRTLKHAEAEERGLYKQIAESTPELRDTIVGLTRDHTILRILVNEIKEMLASEGMNKEVLKRFEALVLVDLIHNEDEEKILDDH